VPSLSKVYNWSTLTFNFNNALHSYNYVYQGTCGKGDRCKFSHDLEIERKAEKRSLYCDVREDDKETSEDWDEEKLKDVIEKKHAEAD
jgi:hypothetical protein